MVSANLDPKGLIPREFSPSVDDVLLASVAIRIQLSPSAHRTAVERYETIGRFLEDHPGLLGGVARITPQGSMATRTTVAAREDEEFDIDLVAILANHVEWRQASPAEILDNFYSVFNNSGIYKGMVSRNTRCVTITYSDGMHLDVTPLQYRDALARGLIMHHRKEDRVVDPWGVRVPSTPEGFAAWFEDQMPSEPAFGRFYESKSLEFEKYRALLKADVQEVPEHEPAFQKPRAKICLQLIKRSRNIRYENRKERCPPSVLLALLVGEVAHAGETTTGLLDELQRIVSYLIDTLVPLARSRILISRTNPADAEEELTDRWPDSERAQQRFLDDLVDMQVKLAALRDAKVSDKRAILKDLFGETAAQSAASELDRLMAQEFFKDGQAFEKGAAAAVALGSEGSRSDTFTPRRKDFFGGEL